MNFYLLHRKLCSDKLNYKLLMRLKEEKIKETPAFYRKEEWKLVNPLKHH